MTGDASGHFMAGGAGYARHRPTYPPEVAADLAAVAPSRALAIDVGCGNGQLSTLLALHFERVLATDVSADQLANARAHPHIDYRCEPAEAMSAADGSAAIVTVAQAAHWFDLERFYAEVRRVAAPGAVLALVTYGVPEITDAPDLAARLHRFYWHEIHPFWPRERRHVETAYRELPLPFPELATAPRAIELSWSGADLVGYVRTWSAVKAAQREGRDELVEAFAHDVPAERGVTVSWPVHVRAARVTPPEA